MTYFVLPEEKNRGRKGDENAQIDSANMDEMRNKNGNNRAAKMEWKQMMTNIQWHHIHRIFSKAWPYTCISWIHE